MKFETAVDVVDIREPLQEFADFVDANPDVWVKVPDGWVVDKELPAVLSMDCWLLKASDVWVRRTAYWESRTDEDTRQWVRYSEQRAIWAWLREENQWRAHRPVSMVSSRGRWFK